MSQPSFTPDDIPVQSGRVFFITGGTAGLGATSISLLSAKDPKHIFFSGRNGKRADELIAKVNAKHPDVPLTFIHCDLADLSSVKQACESLLAKTDRLDVFYANAGIMGLPPALTKDGYELQFGTNHLGHALMIKLLLPLMLRTTEEPVSDVRIVNMSSIAYKTAPKQGIAFDSLKTTQDGLGGPIPGGKWARYGQSKLSNMLYARELAKRYPKITTVSIHPGYIKTDIFTGVPYIHTLPVRLMVLASDGWTPPEEGPYNQTWAGTTPKENLESGAYYVPIAKKGKLETIHSRNEKLAGRLWEWTQKELEAWT